MRAIPNRLLPGSKDHRWIPLIWLPYFLFYLLQPWLDHASRRNWIITGIGAVFFFYFFFGMFWAERGRHWRYLAGLVALGLATAPFNYGAATFFIYACAFVPFAAETEAAALKVIGLIVGLAGLEVWLLHMSWWYYIYAGGFATVIGCGNIFFAQRNRQNEKLRVANAEIEHLAKVAERERIARDLHDVLGHTLTSIIVKSELAEKTMERYPERARKDLQDIQNTAREALAEVRKTIRGYRADSLDAEFKKALATLETAGIEVKAETDSMPLTPAQESVVALIVREAVTNVVRHAAARTCSLRLKPLNGNCLLEIRDDGCGGPSVEGNGLRGMRERVIALGGTLEREHEGGTRLTIQFPLNPPKAAPVQ
ncbi:MAG TPA: sensor histidine kinase [Terriglobales bacterium]|jgi:two-component system sensor histidine kinase DesK